jgi:1,4-dihydroxy-6-naphthoate synthase
VALGRHCEERSDDAISTLNRNSEIASLPQVARNDTLRIAIPGKWTTAALVLDLWLTEEGRQVEKIIIPFDEILNAVADGSVDAGLIIHEGQLTYQTQGLRKLWDAGEWWHKKTGLPLPLGLDVVRSDLGLPLARLISQALRESIHYANAHREEAMTYALQFGRGLDRALGMRFVGMYVNDDTLQQGQEVLEGLKKLYALAFQGKLIPKNPPLTFI